MKISIEGMKKGNGKKKRIKGRNDYKNKKKKKKKNGRGKRKKRGKEGEKHRSPGFETRTSHIVNMCLDPLPHCTIKPVSSMSRTGSMRPHYTRFHPNRFHPATSGSDLLNIPVALLLMFPIRSLAINSVLAINIF